MLSAGSGRPKTANEGKMDQFVKEFVYLGLRNDPYLESLIKCHDGRGVCMAANKSDGRFYGSRCSRTGSVQLGGFWFCPQHARAIGKRVEAEKRVNEQIEGKTVKL